MKSAGLFVDYESTYAALAQAATAVLSHEQVGKHLVEIAAAFGDVVRRVAWADWDRWPGAQRALARMGVETRFVVSGSGSGTGVPDVMEPELLRIAGESHAPDLFVVAGASSTLAACLRTVRARGKEVVVVARKEVVPDAIRDLAGAFVPLPLPPGADVPERRQRRVAEASAEVSEAPDALVSVRSALVAMLSERRLPWVSFRLFSDYLVTHGVTSADRAKGLIESAVARGYLHRERERGATRSFYKFTPGRLGAGETGDRRGGTVPASSEVDFRPRPMGGDRGEPPDSVPFIRAGTSGPPGRWKQDWRNFIFVRMLWALEDIAADEEAAGRKLSPRAVADALREGGIGHSEEEVSFWINQAVDRGLLICDGADADRVDGVQGPVWYHLNRHHRLVRCSEVVPVAIVQTIDVVLERCPDWTGIAFNFLIRLLRVHPALSNPADEYHVYRLREWINFLIDDGLLSKFEEPDLKDPSRKTTMVKNDLAHPQTRRFLEQAPKGRFFHPEHQAVLRTILMIDHFLYWLHTKSPEEDWLPLMTLKSWLRNSLGDQLTKWAVSACEEQHIFTIQRYQNKGGGEATVAGVCLSYTHPLVSETLVRRDLFLKTLIHLLQDRASVPYRMLEAQLEAEAALGDTRTERLGWFALMVDAKVLTLEYSATAGEARGAGLECRLNAQEKFVGELVTRVIRDEGFVPSSRRPGRGGAAGVGGHDDPGKGDLW